MRKNTDQKNSEYKYFSRSATLHKIPEYLGKLYVSSNFQNKKLDKKKFPDQEILCSATTDFSKKFFFQE